MLYKSNNARFRYCFSSVWFLCALVAAMAIPDFEMASAMIGSLAALLMFVFPGVALLVSFTNRKFYRCLLGLFCVVFGTFLFAFAFTNSLMWLLPSSAATRIFLFSIKTHKVLIKITRNFLYKFCLSAWKSVLLQRHGKMCIRTYSPATSHNLSSNCEIWTNDNFWPDESLYKFKINFLSKFNSFPTPLLIVFSLHIR